jgi:hypothetical protein
MNETDKRELLCALWTIVAIVSYYVSYVTFNRILYGFAYITSVWSVVCLVQAVKSVMTINNSDDE